MLERRSKVPSVMLGVGAAFDFLGGMAPRWMQHAGLEWVHRLASDPKRLWKPYPKHNPRFVFFFRTQHLRHWTGRR
jgi:N-acetylglucosaminyldiphosphoundecaprenol N-acetyl-beta-D-mannosaminyltransferase